MDAKVKGRALFELFDKVVILTEQVQVKDNEWKKILLNLREGKINMVDIEEIHRLQIQVNEMEDLSEWVGVPLITPRHGVQILWNEAALKWHAR